MEQNFSLTPVHTDKQIQEISNLASVIWHEHFTPIIGIQQVEYMLEKFQSFHALKEQMETGYEYFQIFDNTEFCGYCGIHQEETTLFLSKLYLKKEARNRHLSTKTIQYLKTLCQIAVSLPSGLRATNTIRIPLRSIIILDLRRFVHR